MWKPLKAKGSRSAAKKPLAAQKRGTLAPRAKEASMVGPTRRPASVLVVAAGFCSLAALVFFVSAASSQTRLHGTATAFHATKDCAGFTGLVGAFCTIRSSNVTAITVGSKIFYFQVAGKTALDSDMAVYVRRGTLATGHCVLHFGRTTQGINHTGKFDQQAIAGRFDDTPAMYGDCSVD